ncbi:endothelin receptor type B-like [Mercenaria mercenaria]|uniref:endothelin receptor type B-like n=1 Tax=Mercenaria mercenaria TaxID=6596 RepID=UPI00234F8187|nr:endothelin receptor type B-like [Mercenaria mercenaria]
MNKTNNTFADIYSYEDFKMDYYNIYYDGDIENLKSLWVREPHFIPLITIYTCVFLCGVVGNVLVLFAILGSKKTRNVTFLFMMSLAAGDLLFVLVCVPVDSLGMLIGHWAGGRVFCKLSGYVEMLSAMASILNLTIISVERYVVIVMPLKSRRNCTVGRTRRLLVLLWLAAMVLSAPSAIVRDIAVTTFFNNETEVQTSICGEHASDDILLSFAIYQLVVMFVLPSLIMAYCYTFVIHALWISRHTLSTLTYKQDSRSNLYRNNRFTMNSQSLKVNTNGLSPTQSRMSVAASPSGSVKIKMCLAVDNRNKALKARKQVVKMLVTVVVMFLLCWGPKLILQVLKSLQLEALYYPEVFQAQIGIYCLTYVQSCVNPIIYGLMCKNFRTCLRHYCSRICCCRKSEDINVLTNMSGEMDSRNSSDSCFKQNRIVITSFPSS